jgi:ParB family transcriptional regulator, chromosome partitioning protein
VSRRSGLGRGLGALIPSGGPASSTSELVHLPLNQIKPSQFQPRKQFDEEALTALVDSIRAVGVLQPILVREAAPGDYEIIAGERRFRAAHRAGLATIPAVIRPVDDVSSLEQALVENLQREDLNPLDEAGAYQQLIEDFNLTHDEVARRIGKSRTAVTNALRLFQLPPTVQRQVRDSLLTAGHARALLGSPDRALQERLALETIQLGLSVRALEELVRAAVRADSAELELLRDTGDGDVFAPGGSGGLGYAPGAGGAAGRTGLRPTPPVGGEPSEFSGQASPPTRLRPPGVLDLEELLGDHLNTRVTVEMGGKHGRVVIEFANLDDLERIYRVIIGESPAGP